MLFGNTLCGSQPINGELINFRLQTNPETFVTYDHRWAPEDPVDYVHIVDGELIDVNQDLNFGIFATSEVTSYNIILQRPYDSVQNNYHGDHLGGKAYLTWTASPDAFAYNIYVGSTLIDTVDNIVATGDLVVGQYEGDPKNESYTVTITSATTFTTTYIPATTFTIKDRVYLGDGLSLDFKNTEYSVSDVFNFNVGPQNYYLTDLLNNGDTTFTIKAVDEGGNESEEVNVTVNINRRPLGVATLNSSINEDDDILLSWTQPTDATITGYRIYSNYSHVYNDFVETTDVLVEDISPATSYVFTPPIDGAYRFYVQSYNSVSESDSILMTEIDTTQPIAEIGQVENVILSPSEDGKFFVSWIFNHSLYPDCDRFKVYVADSELELVLFVANDTPEEIVMVTSKTPTKRYEVEIDPTLSATRYVVIKSATATERSVDETVYSININLTNPDPPSAFVGVPQ